MIKIDNFIKLFEGAVRDSWENPALSDFRKSTITYRELAERIDTLDLIWKKAGLKRGDKIAINARPSAMGTRVRGASRRSVHSATGAVRARAAARQWAARWPGITPVSVSASSTLRRIV